MIEALFILFGVVVLLGVILALGAIGAFIFLVLLLIAVFISKTVLALLILLGLIAIPYLILRAIVRFCRGRKVPGTPIPLGAVLLALLVAGLFAAFPTQPPDVDMHVEDLFRQCDGSGVDLTINGKTYHFSCRPDDNPAHKGQLSM